MIQEAFQERAALTESKLIEHDPIDQHVTALHRTTRDSTAHHITAPHATSRHDTTQQLIDEGEVIEADAAETLATAREVMGGSMGRASAAEANSLESQDE
jgi:hypothetical protein